MQEHNASSQKGFSSLSELPCLSEVAVLAVESLLPMQDQVQCRVWWALLFADQASKVHEGLKQRLHAVQLHHVLCCLASPHLHLACDIILCNDPDYITLVPGIEIYQWLQSFALQQAACRQCALARNRSAAVAALLLERFSRLVEVSTL